MSSLTTSQGCPPAGWTSRIPVCAYVVSIRDAAAADKDGLLQVWCSAAGAGAAPPRVARAAVWVLQAAPDPPQPPPPCACCPRPPQPLLKRWQAGGLSYAAFALPAVQATIDWKWNR